jgi:hypothetical protein
LDPIRDLGLYARELISATLRSNPFQGVPDPFTFEEHRSVVNQPLESYTQLAGDPDLLGWSGRSSPDAPSVGVAWAFQQSASGQGFDR